MSKSYYLDANAHIPIQLSNKSQTELETIRRGQSLYGHPLSPSYIGISAATAIEKSRYNICQQLGISNPSKLFFTYSCTQANEWACQILSSIVKSKVSVSKFEHPSMRAAYNAFKFDDGVNIQINEDGSIIDEVYDNAICMYVQSESGLIVDIEKIRKQTSGYLVSDIAQAVGKMSINLEKLDIDIATFGAHKFGGPIGVGCLYLKDSSVLQPYGKGIGTSYCGDIPGTSNVEGIIITSLALRDAYNTFEERHINCEKFREVLEGGLKKLDFEIVCEKANRISNTTFVRVPKDKGA